MMFRLFLPFIAALIVLLGTPAFGVSPPPTDKPPASQPINADLKAGAAAGAIAGAGAVSGSSSSSNSSSTGTGVGLGIGQGGSSTSSSSAAGGSSSSGASADGQQQQQQGQESTLVNEGDSNRYSARSLALFLPPPVFTPPMAKVDCAGAMITQDAMSILWSGFSKASAKTDSSDCTLINIRNAKVETCQYASAKKIEDLLVRKHLPDFEPETVFKGDRFIDYTPEQCALLRAPPAKPAEVVYLSGERVEVPVYVDRPCPDGWKRNSKGVCYDPAWIAEARQCRQKESYPLSKK